METAQDAIKPVGREEQTATDTQRSSEELHQLARLAEISERYEDMKGYVKELVIGKQGDISTHERDLLSIAYKHVVASVRNAHRIVQNVSAKRINDDEKVVVEQYRGDIQKRLLAVCSELQDLLSNYLIPKAEDVSSKVFYQKMMGDYTRYVAETKGQDEDFKEIVEKSRHAYQQAFDLATKNMPPTDPILLGLVLNFSVFYYEIANAAPEAAQLAKKAYDDAVANLEGLDENAYKDSTMIMELLRENLALWKLDGGTETSDDEQTAEAPALEEHPNPDASNKEEEEEKESVAAPDAMQVDTPKEEQQPGAEQTKPDERGEPMDADEQGSAVIAKVESHNESSDKQEGAKTETIKDEKPATEED